MTPESRLVPLLDRLALFLGVLGALLHWTVHATTAGSGMNAFLQLLFWVALALWFAARALSGGASWKFTGFEYAFLAFAIVSLVSVLRASYRLPALEHAFRDLSLALLFLLAVQCFGTRTLLALLLPTLAALSVYAIFQAIVLTPRIDTSGFDLEGVRRTRSHEPWSTFIGPNQLAGFLVLLLPLLGGFLRDSQVRWPAGAALALGLVALGLTGSAGGWVSLGIGLVAFVALGATRTRGRREVVLGGGLLAALLVALVLTTPLLDWVSRKSISMRVRQVYWKATGRIIKDAPLGGVGLDNFREYYTATKPDAAWETVYAHNDYLQVLAETGVFGFLAFAGILAWGLRKALPREAARPEEPRAPPWTVLPAAIVAFVVSGILTGDLGDPLSLVSWGVTALVFIAARILFRQAAPDPALPWTRIGAAAGLAAFLVQMSVDFEFYEPAVALTLVLALAFLALLRGDATTVPIPPRACGAAAGVLGLVALPLLVGVVPRLLAADAERAEARNGRPDALRLAESAIRHVPQDAESRLLFAQLNFETWSRRRAKALRDEAARLDCRQAEEVARQAIDDALLLRPRSSPYHYAKAIYLQEFHRFALEAAKTTPSEASVLEVRAREDLHQAAAELGMAVDLYPTFAPIRYRLSRLLEEDGRPAEARPQYREALRLTQVADLEPWITDRMRLTPLQRARCLVRQGERPAAQSLLEQAFRAGRPSPEELSEEADDLMRPVIEAARDAILAPDQSKGPK
jgi:O-antigen ligase